MTAGAFVLLATVGCVWGSSFLLIRVAIEDISPLQLTFYRCIGGAAILWAFVGLRQPRSQIRTSGLGYPLLISLVGAVIPFLLIARAQTKIESGTAALLDATMPLFTAVFAGLFLSDERLTPSRLAGLAVGLLGVALLIGSQPLRA